MSFFARVAPAPKQAAKQSLFTIAEIQGLLAAWIIRQCLDKASFAPKDALNAVPEFRERGLQKANVIGDAMGHRGYKLYRGKSGFVPGYENAALVLEWHQDHDSLAAELGFSSADELQLRVIALGWADFSDEDREAAAEAFGYASSDELAVAIAALA